MRAIIFMLVGALIATFAIKYDFQEHNQADIVKTKERIAEASKSQS